MKTTKYLFKNKTKLFGMLLIILCFCYLPACGSNRPAPAMAYTGENYLQAPEKIEYDRSQLDAIPHNLQPALSVPTYVTKVDDIYFIVDCYNNQVIYNDNMTAPLQEWNIMTGDVTMAHTLASDGTVYLIDDTENHRILVMEKDVTSNGEIIFVPTQRFSNIGNRPHYIIYDEYTDTFYAWSSQSGEMYLFRRKADTTEVYLTEIRNIPSLNGVYARSFTIIEDRIYFVSGNSTIIEADLDTFEIKKEYPVPAEMSGMIQITPIENYYYITISTDVTGNQDYATMIRVKDLDDLAKGNYEDVYSHFIGGGTPYYITRIDDIWYLTEHRLPGHSIWSFQIIDDQITNVQAIY